MGAASELCRPSTFVGAGELSIFRSCVGAASSFGVAAAKFDKKNQVLRSCDKVFFNIISQFDYFCQISTKIIKNLTLKVKFPRRTELKSFQKLKNSQISIIIYIESEGRNKSSAKLSRRKGQ